MSAETILNFAKAAWHVIEDGAPSADLDGSTANAMPDVDNWQDVTDARGPNVYQMAYNIGFVWPFEDYDHVQIKILLKWQFGGRYRGGGAFIPNVWVEVPECFVGWGWDVDIDLVAQNPTNAGQSGAPLACLPVTVKGTVKSVLESYHVEWGAVLYGDGRLDPGA